MNIIQQSSSDSRLLALSASVPQPAALAILGKSRIQQTALTGLAMLAGSVYLLQTLEDSSNHVGRVQLAATPPQSIDQSQNPLASLSPQQQVAVLQSPETINPALERLQSQYSDLTYQSIHRSLNITYQPNTQSFAVIYRDADPQKVETVLAALTQTYVDYGQRCGDSCQQVQSIESQMDSLQQHIQQMQAQLQQLKKYAPTIVEQQIQQHTAQVDRLAKQQQFTKQKLAAARRLQTSVQQKIQSQPIVLQILSQTTHYEKRLQQLQGIDRRYAQELSHTQPNLQQLQALQNQRKHVVKELYFESQFALDRYFQQIAPQLQSSIFRDANNWRMLELLVQTTLEMQIQSSYLQTLQQAEQPLVQQLKQWQTVKQQSAYLQAEIQTATQTLHQYAAKRDGVRSLVAAQPFSWRVIAPPEMITERRIAVPALLSKRQY